MPQQDKCEKIKDALMCPYLTFTYPAVRLFFFALTLLPLSRFTITTYPAVVFIFLRTYPAVPLFFYALLLCPPRFSLTTYSVPCCALILLCTYPAVTLIFSHLRLLCSPPPELHTSTPPRLHACIAPPGLYTFIPLRLHTCSAP